MSCISASDFSNFVLNFALGENAEGKGVWKG